MVAVEVYYIREFKKGDFMLWNVCSQCANDFTIEIRDDNKTYDRIIKSNHDTALQKLSQKAAIYEGGSNLRIVVEFNNTKEIRESAVSGGILDRKGNTVGYSYTYCYEDSEDWDFNDAYLTITAWRKKG